MKSASSQFNVLSYLKMDVIGLMIGVYMELSVKSLGTFTNTHI